MATKRWYHKLWPWSRKTKGATDEASAFPPLREFVYLDEVSLQSLLASQTGAVTEQVSSANTQAKQAELVGKLSANAPGVAKSEINSRYQTSNSQSIQTSRKAIVQSLFKEFRDSSGNRLLLQPSEVTEPLASIDAIIDNEDALRSLPSQSFRRGSLIEIEVELSVDPVFKLSTMFVELSELAKDFPALLQGSGAESTFAEMAPVNKTLQHLLAGLIPIRSEAIGYSVVTVDEKEYVVHNDAIRDISIERSPLEIVGVTEHLGYWKDIRRILFSGARVTMLCRVARDGVQRSWTPVKLADLFSDLVPDLTEQLNAAGLAGISGQPLTSGTTSQIFISNTLKNYSERSLERLDQAPSQEELTALEAYIETIVLQDDGASSQREAFRTLDQYLQDQLNITSTPEEQLELRQLARSATGVDAFSGLSSDHRDSGTTARTNEGLLLDTEVIAIYW